VHRFLVGKLQGKSPLGGPRRGWEYTIKMDGGQNVHRVLLRKPEGKRPLERPRRRWEDNIKIDGGQICAQGSREAT
jgi:hypothetical protein